MKTEDIEKENNNNLNSQSKLWKRALQGMNNHKHNHVTRAEAEVLSCSPKHKKRVVR